MLLAHDLTGQSEIALVRASRLTLERDGHLTVVHVINSELPASMIEVKRAHAKRYLETEVRRWLGRCNLSYRIDIAIGDPAGAIAARAQAGNVNLVVVGRHQRRTILDKGGPAIVGRLTKQVHRPILVVGRSNQSPYRRVLIPIDLTTASTATVQFAAAFLPQASLHLLHPYKKRFQDYISSASVAFSQGDEAGNLSGPVGPRPRCALPTFIEAMGLGERRPIVTTERGDPLVLVKKELARQKTDLLVLEKHAPIGTGVKAALRASPCDVLLLSV